MRKRINLSTWTFSAVAALFLAAPTLAQQAPEGSAEHGSKAGPVVRTFGSEGGFRTEVTSETKGSLNKEDQRQVSLLAAQVFQHVDEARRALEADEVDAARKELNMGRNAVEAVQQLLPKTHVHTKTTAPDGKVIYEHERDVQQNHVPLFEGMIQARTLAPIQDAQQDEPRIAGVRVVESERLSTEVVADLAYVDARLRRALKALDDKKPDEAVASLLLAQVKGVDFRYTKEDAPLAEARDAIWLAKRALEENNSTQAHANLQVARQWLEIYRQVLPEDQRKDVDQMMSEVNQLRDKLRKESSASTSQANRANQGNTLTKWWEQVNSWFKKK
jgi:Na+-translocating ferredoxin:NAD+ oxidoreductase RnfG subunit